MKRVLTAVILIPLVLVLVFLGPRGQWLFTLATALVAALAGWEYLGLAERGGAKPPRVAVIVAVLLLFTANLQAPEQRAHIFELLDALAIFGLLSLGLLVYCTFLRPVAQVMRDASTSIFCLFYVGFTLTFLPALREQTNGPSLLIFLLFVVWAGDTAALYVGRPWGRHKLAPTISPGKSWEGSIASIAGSVLVTAGLLEFSSFLAGWDYVKLSYADETWWYWLGLAVVVNIAAQVGDLAESALKRSVSVKDSGTLLPGHGGVLDRVDALLLAAPVLWYVHMIYQRF